jgi:hypothetical protein
VIEKQSDLKGSDDVTDIETIDVLPAWAEWLDDRRVAVECKACHTTYTGRYWSDFAGKDRRGGWTGGVPKSGCTVCKRRAAEEARKALPMDAALVAAVRDHALAHYDRDGWDFVVEAYTDAELWGVIAGAKTPAKAIAAAKSTCKLLAARRSGDW